MSGCTYKTWKNCELTASDTLPWLHLTQLLKTLGGKCYRNCFSPLWCFWEKKGRASVITTNPVMTKQRGKIQKKNKPKKLVETTKTVKTETKTRGEKKPANSTQVTKSHRQLNNLKHQGSNPACGLCRIV